MAQLTDDCFAFSGPLLPVAEAERLISARVTPVSGRETVPLRAALARVLAADVVAPVDLPPFDNSAVDGYAVRGDDIDAAGERRLVIVDRIAAGHSGKHAVKPGEAVRIFTGAPMPVGADTVRAADAMKVLRNIKHEPQPLEQLGFDTGRLRVRGWGVHPARDCQR
jgi:molybdopterin molybdotransferase